MSTSRNEQLLTPRPAASNLVGDGGHSADSLRARRDAKDRHIYKNRRMILAAMGVVAVAGGAAGSARLLAHDTEQGVRDAFNNRVEAVSDAFSDSNPGVVTGEPSNADAAHQAQVNEAHNAAVAAAKTDQFAAQSK